MIKIIDATLANLDRYDLSSDQLFLFCDYMKQMGIIDLEISLQSYKTMKTLPEGFNFYLNMGPFDKKRDFTDVYKYIISKVSNEEKCICGLQINDVKELLQFKKNVTTGYVKIAGLDDLMNYDYEHIFEEIKTIFKGKTVIFCPENHYDCASSLAVMWLCSGGKLVVSSFTGCGNLAATEEIYMAMRVISRFKQNQSLLILSRISKWYEEVTNTKILNNKPILGRKIFYVESGIHVDGILKNPLNYEPYKSEIVGKKTKIVIGKHSGTSSVKIKLGELDILLEDKKLIKDILKIIKKKSMEKRGGLTDIEFKNIVSEVVDHGKKMDC